MRILICEDDPSRSEALGASVGIACPGAEVQRAVPGTSAARAVAEAAPALTIVGPGLADADGGSEVVARAVHALGRRAAGPFVPVNGTVSPRSATGSKSPYESPLAVAIHAMLSRMC